MDQAHVFVPITSITKADGGRTRIVKGFAATDRLDYEGQHSDFDWLKRELETWFKVGNMREDHRPGGVGKAIEIDFDDQNRTVSLVSKAVDRDTIVKLDEGVLTGYSWGAKSVPGNPIRIKKGVDGFERVTSGKIVEMSYVDHPANPDCFVTVGKSVSDGDDWAFSNVVADLGRAGNNDSDGDESMDGGKSKKSKKPKGRKNEPKMVKDDGPADHDDHDDDSNADTRTRDRDDGRPWVKTTDEIDLDALLKAIISDIDGEVLAEMGKRDVSTAERESLGKKGDAISTSGTKGKKTAYPIANRGDLKNAIRAYGRANPQDRAKVRRHIISEARRLGMSDAIPDSWKSIDGVLSKSARGGSGCCDDCSSICDGSCCTECTMGLHKGIANPGQLAQSIKSMAKAETDGEYRGFLGKVAKAVDGWARMDGVSVPMSTYATVATLAKGAMEPDLTKRRETYTVQNRAQVEQAINDLHHALGVFMEGAVAIDDDKDMSTDRLTGQDAPPVGDQPGGGHPAGGGGVLNDSTFTQDGNAQVRSPDGRQNGYARDETGKSLKKHMKMVEARLNKALDKAQKAPSVTVKTTHTGDQPQSGTLVDEGLVKSIQSSLAEIQTLKKAVRKSSRRRDDVELADLRKQVAALTDGRREPVVDPTSKGDVERLVRKQVQKMEKLLRGRDSGDPDASARALASVEEGLRDSITDLRRSVKRDLKSSAQSQRRVDEVDRLSKQIAAMGPQSENQSLLLADLVRAAFEQTQKEQEVQTKGLKKLLKGVLRELSESASARDRALSNGQADLQKKVEALERTPRPGGPSLMRPTEKEFAVNDTLERGVPANQLQTLRILKELSESSDHSIAGPASTELRKMMEGLSLTS
jgi:hypothetical protein